MKELTLLKKAELGNKYSAVNVFIYRAYKKGIIDEKIGKSLYKYVRKLMLKDYPLIDANYVEDEA